MASKIKIKIGKIEFEYEGQTEFAQNDIKDVFSHLEALSSSDSEPSDSEGGASLARKGQNGTKKLHTSTIASRLVGKSAPNLVVSAAAHLQIIEGKKTFSRQELLADMKSATTHYNQNMSSNLTKMLNTMISQQTINKVGTDSYSLSDIKITELEKLIAK